MEPVGALVGDDLAQLVDVEVVVALETDDQDDAGQNGDHQQTFEGHARGRTMLHHRDVVKQPLRFGSCGCASLALITGQPQPS